MNGRGNSSAAANELLAALAVNGHNRCITEKSAKFNHFALPLTDDGNDANGGRFVVDNANGDLVGNDARAGLGRGITGNGDHIESDRANGGHRLKLFKR